MAPADGDNGGYTMSALYPAIHEFLLSQGLAKTAKQLMQEAALMSPLPPAEPGAMLVLRGCRNRAGLLFPGGSRNPCRRKPVIGREAQG